MPRQIHGERVVDSEGDYLGGLTVEWNDPLVRLGADLLVRHDGPHESQLERRRDIAALSLRASAELAAARYHVEIIGEAGSEGFLALAAIGEGYVRLAADWRPELGLGLTYGSGSGPGSAADELENFFPSNHQIYGLADLLGLRNQAQLFVQATVTPLAGALSAWIAARLFALPEPGGRWSSAGGGTVGVNELNREGVLGGELDIEARWRPMEGVDVWAGYALFLPAAGARALGRDEPMHFGYVMAGARLPD